MSEGNKNLEKEFAEKLGITLPEGNDSGSDARHPQTYPIQLHAMTSEDVLISDRESFPSLWSRLTDYEIIFLFSAVGVVSPESVSGLKRLVESGPDYLNILSVLESEWSKGFCEGIKSLENPVRHDEEALRLDRLAKSSSSSCTVNGQDLYGNILDGIFDAHGIPQPGDDKLKNMFE